MKEKHGIRASFAFRLKRLLLQARRGAQNLARPPTRLSRGGDLLPCILFESRTQLRRSEAPAERTLTLGKIQNLRVAAPKLNGLILEPGELFSFWNTLGRLSRAKGYVAGRELREGCLIPSIGGGICQLSNALYQGALRTGCEIVERHEHSAAVPGSDAAHGADATVAWNDIDLRFRSSHRIQIECQLTPDELVLRFLGEVPISIDRKQASRVPRPLKQVRSCVTCGETDCHRHVARPLLHDEVATTYVLDSSWPEWRAMVKEVPGRILVPRTGSGGRYDWGDGAETVAGAAFIRSVRARLVSGKPPAVVRSELLASDQRVARSMGRRLRFTDDSLVIAQSLLPGLWRSGVLAGRRFRVALSGLPLSLLHERLDQAFAIDPDPSLVDFRAADELVADEAAALAASLGVIAPHVGIGQLLEQPVQHIEWVRPAPQALDRTTERLIVFPGPAIARNGSRAVREVARKLNLQVAILGSMLEPREWWDGIEIVDADGWESRCMAVVQPSVVENRPGTLLRASALGIPIVATSLCGLAPGEYVEVGFGDSDALRNALEGVSSLTAA